MKRQALTAFLRAPSWRFLYAPAFHTLLAALVLLVPMLSPPDSDQASVLLVSLMLFALLGLLLIAKYVSRRAYTAEFWLLIACVVAYLAAGVLGLGEGPRGLLRRQVLLPEVRILVFGMSLFFIIRLEQLAKVTPPLPPILPAPPDTVSTRDAPTGATPVDPPVVFAEPQPQWWEVRQHLTEQKLKLFDGEKDIDGYDLLLECGEPQIDRAAKTLVILLPDWFFSPRLSAAMHKQRQKVADQLIFEVGVVFKGYDIKCRSGH